MSTKKSYEDWIGREICYIDSEGPQIPCILAGIDPDIGVTLAFAENSPWLKKYGFKDPVRGAMCVCLHGPLSPKWRDHRLPPHFYRDYGNLFDAWVSILSEGSVVSEEELIHLSNYEAAGVGSICPFLG